MTSSGVTRVPAVEYHERRANLAEVVVGHAHHRHLRHAVHGPDDLLDLRGRHVESADDEHVLLAVGDTEVAPFVEEPHVSGVEPSVRP